MGTKLVINDALYSSKSRRILINFKAIRQNGYHMETKTINEKEFLCLTTESNGTKIILERMLAYSLGLYLTHIRPIEINVIRLDNKELFTLWHDHLGHPSTGMMYKIKENSVGHPLRNIKIPQLNELLLLDHQ